MMSNSLVTICFTSGLSDEHLLMYSVKLQFPIMKLRISIPQNLRVGTKRGLVPASSRAAC